MLPEHLFCLSRMTLHWALHAVGLWPQLYCKEPGDFASLTWIWWCQVHLEEQRCMQPLQNVADSDFQLVTNAQRNLIFLWSDLIILIWWHSDAPISNKKAWQQRDAKQDTFKYFHNCDSNPNSWTVRWCRKFRAPVFYELCPSPGCYIMWFLYMQYLLSVTIVAAEEQGWVMLVDRDHVFVHAYVRNWM